MIDVPQVRKKIGKELGVPKLSKNVQQALLDSKHKKRRVRLPLVTLHIY